MNSLCSTLCCLTCVTYVVFFCCLCLNMHSYDTHTHTRWVPISAELSCSLSSCIAAVIICIRVVLCSRSALCVFCVCFIDLSPSTKWTQCTIYTQLSVRKCRVTFSLISDSECCCLHFMLSTFVLCVCVCVCVCVWKREKEHMSNGVYMLRHACVWVGVCKCVCVPMYMCLVSSNWLCFETLVQISLFTANVSCVLLHPFCRE